MRKSMEMKEENGKRMEEVMREVEGIERKWEKRYKRRRVGKRRGKQIH